VRAPPHGRFIPPPARRAPTPTAPFAPPPPQKKPANQTVLRALFAHLQAAHADARVSAIVVTGAGKNFSAGFDIAQFAKGGGGGGIDDTINAAICALLEGGPKPTVAAVQGVALGGGLEVAMGCNARVAAKGARMGLPELQLGIIPGFGGTQRLPRLVGLQKAIEMMLTSKPVKAEAAAKLGLVDALVDSPAALLDAARARALAIARGEAPRMLSLRRADKLPAFGEAAATVEFARAEALKRAPHLRHPQFCLDAVLAGIAEGGDAGLKAEGEAFARSAALDTHKALVHVFFASRATKKIKGIEGVKPRAIKRVAVIGGGLMGSGIATALVLNGVDVALKEISQQFLDGGLGRVRANVASSVKKGRMTQAQADAALARLTGCLDYGDPAFKGADVVIEAVIEDIPLKQRIFVDVEKAVSPECTLATNTSTIDLDLIGAKLPSAAAKARVVGAHFFSPAHVMPLLEIVRAKDTSPQAVVDTLAMGAIIKKTPVVVGNCTGFAVNRVFFPYTMAAMLLADCGLNPYLVDKAIAGFGMPMGPFRLNDLVGSGALCASALAQARACASRSRRATGSSADTHARVTPPPSPHKTTHTHTPHTQTHRHRPARRQELRRLVPRPRLRQPAHPVDERRQAPRREDQGGLLRVRRPPARQARPGHRAPAGGVGQGLRGAGQGVWRQAPAPERAGARRDRLFPGGQRGVPRDRRGRRRQAGRPRHRDRLRDGLPALPRRARVLGRPGRGRPHLRAARGARGAVCARGRGGVLHALRVPPGGGQVGAQAERGAGVGGAAVSFFDGSRRILGWGGRGGTGGTRTRVRAHSLFARRAGPWVFLSGPSPPLGCSDRARVRAPLLCPSRPPTPPGRTRERKRIPRRLYVHLFATTFSSRRPNLQMQKRRAN